MQPNLQENLRRIMEHLFLQQGVDEVIFFGASGGGFAALYYSFFFPNSLALPINPQTDISMYIRTFVHAYADKAWQVDPNEYDPLRLITANTEVLSMYTAEAKNTVIYVQNTGDENHVNRHYIPFMEVAKASRGIYAMMEDWGKGHVPPSRGQLKILLELACTSNDWTTFAEEIGVAELPVSQPLIRPR
ncbi:hypothetical protein [Kocuria sp. UCD-OTCP]|uniref:hypothetical protein n=1 Tax=Kocuria sp. UCD-OTCP TaxID=1292021 RepID=UPI00167FC481|nr:hypothetical protein [Kocuria sp. UCD-OTCP]